MSVDTRPRAHTAQEQRRVARADVHIGRWERLADRARAGHWQVSAVAATAVALGSLCMAPLLDGSWWFARVVAVVSLIAVVGGLSRSLRIPAALTPLVQFAALMVFLTWSFAGEEARWGFVPGPAAVTRLQELVAQGRSYAMDTQPPAGPDLGLLLLIVAGVALAALVVDTLAAGLDLPGLTLAPLAALFLVPWVVNRGTAPWWSFAVVALGWLAILSALQRDRAARWSPGARPGSPGTALIIAGAATTLALLAGTLGTLRGPADAVGPAAGNGSGPVRIDALVSLRRALVSNDSRAVMTYTATTPRPGYLRLSILEDFDGEAWRPIESDETAGSPPAVGDGPVPSLQQPPPGPIAEYQFAIGPLTGTTLPSPRGTFGSLNEWPVVWDQRTSLPIRADGQSIEGTTIGLVAAEQGLDSAALRAASAVPPRPEEVFPENLADPRSLVGGRLAELAREVTAGAQSPFDAAVALQRWFSTDGGFTYSTQIDGGSDSDALSAFLNERVGYCEQFAATMALMARSVGIPARVAVGFTQGRRDGTQWEVRGTDAHAWPELWMGTAGWVRFEPTPGAPTTATPLYTLGAGEGQDEQDQPVQESQAPLEDETEPTDPAAADALDAGAAAGSQTAGLPLRWILGSVLLVLLLLPAALRWMRRRRRLARADGESLYREVVDTVLDLRLGRPATTPRATLAEVARWTDRSNSSGEAPESQSTAAALLRIQRAVEWQRYGKPVSAQPAPSPGPQDARTVRPRGSEAVVPVGALLTGTPPALSGRIDEPSLSPQDAGVVRRALALQAGRGRRLLAALAPASVITSLLARGPHGDGPASG